jgi:hypothetical protein
MNLITEDISLTGLFTEENKLEFTQRVSEFAAARHLYGWVFRYLSVTSTNSTQGSLGDGFIEEFPLKNFFATSRASFSTSVRMRGFYFRDSENNETSVLIG